MGTLPDIGKSTPHETMALARRCFEEMTPADCISVIMTQYPDLDELIEELQTEADLRHGDGE